MLSVYSCALRSSILSSSKFKSWHRTCCIRLSSGTPDLPEAKDSGLPPSKIPDLPFPTIYNKFPQALQCYKYDGIAQFATFTGTKRLLIPFSVLVISSAIMCRLNDLISTDDVLFATTATVSLIVTHFVTCMSLKNFVGFIYIDQETNETIVSYIDSFGLRVDRKFMPGDLYFQARGNVLDKLFIFLISRKTGMKFRVNIRHASIFSQELLEEVVSEIPDTAF